MAVNRGGTCARMKRCYRCGCLSAPDAAKCHECPSVAFFYGERTLDGYPVAFGEEPIPVFLFPQLAAAPARMDLDFTSQRFRRASRSRSPRAMRAL
jgi:hypothetical protein